MSSSLLLETEQFIARVAQYTSKPADQAEHSLIHLRPSDPKVSKRLAQALSTSSMVKSINRYMVDDNGVSILTPRSRLEDAVDATRNLRLVVGDVDKDVSIGVTGITPGNRYEGNEVVTAAQRASGKAQAKSGINRTHFEAPAPQDASFYTDSALMIQTLQDIVQEGRFILHYQPIVTLGREGLPSYEVLMRVVDRGDPERLYSPLPFIQAAEGYDIVPELDLLIFERVCAQYQELKAKGLDSQFRYFSVNVSAASVGVALAQQMSEIASEYGVEPGRIRLEITETAPQEIDVLEAFVDAAHEAQIPVGIDDFGSGHAWIEYVDRLPIDYIKVDGRIVRGMTGLVPRTFAEAMIHIGAQRGLDVVAEHIEGPELSVIAHEIGFQYAQGHHFGRAKELSAYLS